MFASLRTFIPFLLLLLLVVQGIYIIYMSIQQTQNEIERETISSLEGTLINLQDGFEFLLRTNNSERIQYQIALLGSNPQLKLVMLLDERLRVLASLRVADIDQHLDTLEYPKKLRGFDDVLAQIPDILLLEHARVWSIENHQAIAGIYPIILGARSGQLRPDRVGALLAYRELISLDNYLTLLFERDAVSYLILMIFMLTLVSVILRHRVTSRIQQLIDATKRLSKGDYQIQSALSGTDELSQLGSAFDKMVLQINESRKALEKQNQQIEFLMKSTAEAIYGVDAHGNCTFANPACVRLLGYRYENDLLTRHMHSLIHHTYPDGTSYPVEKCVIYRAFQLNAPVHCDTEFLWRADGSSFPAEFWSYPIIQEDEVVGAVVTFLDISERKMAERALRDSEYKYRSLFDDALDMIHIVDATGYIIDANKMELEKLGYTREELIGKRLLEIIASTHRNITKEIFEQLLDGTYISLYETVLITHSGKEIDIEASIVPYMEKQKMIYARAISRDITERKRAHNELQKYRNQLEELVDERTAELAASNKELESYSYTVSHDLRGPLRSIDGFSQLLLMDYEEDLDETGRDYLRRVRKASQRMGEIIDDLLNLSRVVRTTIEREQIDISKIAREIVAKLRQEYTQCKLDIVLQDHLQAHGDPKLIRILLENLFSNSFKFSSYKQLITINFSSFLEGGINTYCLQDNGAGFDMRYLEKLFLPFQRLHHVDEFEGTGIGLATVARIVQRHGGRIWAQGAVDKGARFCFTLNADPGTSVSKVNQV